MDNTGKGLELSTLPPYHASVTYKMAKRQRDGDINERTQAKLRSGIRAAEIIERLHDHILNGAKMTNTAVRASEILLRKVSPDMIATALSVQDSAKLPLLTIVPAERSIKPVIEHKPDAASPDITDDIPVSHRVDSPGSSVA